MLRFAVMSVLVMGLATVSVWSQEAPTPADLLQNPAVKAALDGAKATEVQTVADQIRFCEIPAPSFKEEVRGQELKRVFEQLGLQNVRIDKVGNVLGDYPGAAPRPRAVIAAHLDTVFPEGTDVKVRRDGAVLHGPGIGDDCRGLAVMVAIVREMKKANVKTPGSITFVANVGEEGLGDLRGVKELFKVTLKDQIDRFVSIDGTGIHVTNVAVGSHRYRVTFKGPGGHSFGAFGMANPMGAMGRAIAKIQELQVPKQPRTTFNVGRIGGGTSVNAIPFEAWFEVDLRSADSAALTALDTRFRALVDEAVAAENARWNRPGQVGATLTVVGDRPGGSTAETAAIVRAARSATAAVGEQMTLRAGSTDANAAMYRGIPALTIDAGGTGSGAHALDERFDSTDSWKGTVRAFLLTVLLAGA